MYDIIENLIGHVWNSDLTSTPQQIIYYISGAIIIVFSCIFIDMIYRLFHNVWGRFK